MSNVVPIRDRQSATTASVEGVPPPHNIDAERAALCGVLLDEPTLGILAAFLKPDHFFDERHRRIYAAALWLRNNGLQVDVVTIAERLRSVGEISLVGGLPYMTEMLAASPHISNGRDHAKIVLDTWRLRQAIAVMQHATAAGYHAPGEAQSYLEGVADRILQLARAGIDGPSESNVTALQRIFAEMSARATAGNDTRTIGITSGIDAWDRLTGGFHPGEKTTIAALTGVGKTAIALQFALTAASPPELRPGFRPRPVGVLFFTTEVTPDQLRYRALANLSDQPLSAIRSGDLTTEQWADVTKAMNRLAKMPIRFDGTPGLSAALITAKTQFFKHECPRLFDGTPLGMIVVDQVGRLASPPGLERADKWRQIAENTKQLKTLATEHGVAVIELSQLKVKPEFKDEDGIPDIGSWSGSEEVEREADNVDYLWRPSKSPHQRHELLLLRRKHRNGPLDRIGLDMQLSTARFSERYIGNEGT